MTKHKHPEVCRRFGVVLRKRRLSRGLTQKEMAKRVPCHPSHVGAVERGANSSVDMLIRFAKVLHTTVTNLARSANV